MTDSKIVAWITEDDFDNLIDGFIVKISRQKTQRTTVALHTAPPTADECKQREADRRDAARYRWLRENFVVVEWTYQTVHGTDDLDAAIDAAKEPK